MSAALYRTRHKMATHLSSTDVGLEEKIKSVNEYLIYILPFFNSLKNQPAVRLDSLMLFEWIGAFSGDRKSQKFPDVIFEVAMTLHAKSVLHYCLGRQVFKADPIHNFAVAAQNFQTAAGVMDYMATILLPQWLTAVKRPAEADIIVCRAMADFFTADTQYMAVVKESMKGGDVGPLTIKLCVSALRTVDEGLDRFETIRKDELCFGSDIPLFNRTFYAALAYFYSGEAARLKDDNVGIALGYYREAISRVNDITTGKENLAKLDRMSTTSPFLRDGIQHLLNSIRTSMASASRDNDMIFFQPVPIQRDLPSLPTGILVMARKMYNPPADETITMFKYQEERSKIPVGTRWVPIIAVTPSAPSAVTPSAPPAYESSMALGWDERNKEAIDADHKFAMELQKKLNCEDRA
jgi:hypothetical protein